MEWSESRPASVRCAEQECRITAVSLDDREIPRLSAERIKRVCGRLVEREERGGGEMGGDCGFVGAVCVCVCLFSFAHDALLFSSNDGMLVGDHCPERGKIREETGRESLVATVVSDRERERA